MAMDLQGLLYVSIGWGFGMAGLTFLAWQLSGYVTKARADQEIEKLKRRLDREMRASTDLRGENGALQAQLRRAHHESIRAVRKASELAAKLSAKRQENAPLYINDENVNEWPDTESACHV